ncbi:barnase inhibitor [Burkholderia sp. SRS-46]|nr:barnase inhibitor [Burkholderia sp. SRS-46]
MNKFNVDGRAIADWPAFHDFFVETFQFPAYYGRNMDAWNDCMSDYCYERGMVSLHIDNAVELKAMNREVFDALVDCCAFINWRATKAGGDPLMVLSFRA